VISIKFTGPTFGFAATSDIFLMPFNLLYQAEDRYSAVFVASEIKNGESTESNIHTVIMDIPYKLSCSNGEIGLLGDNNIASPKVLSDVSEGTIAPFEFTFKTYEYGRQCKETTNIPQSFRC